MTYFLDRAIDLALDNIKEGGDPFGAVLVNDGEIISEGVNELHLYNDITGHAEILAIRKAQKRLKRLDLKECILYASGEPCPMCLSAIYFSNIKKVYFAETINDANSVGLSRSKEIYNEFTLEKNEREIEMIHINDTKMSPMKKWNE